MSKASNAWYKLNKERVKTARKIRYERNKDHTNAVAKMWRLKNKTRNHATTNERTARRRLIEKGNQLPASYGPEREDILAVYAKASKFGLTVDHYYPHQSRCDTVCGIHSLANLQLMFRFDNIKKHNQRPEVFL